MQMRLMNFGERLKKVNTMKMAHDQSVGNDHEPFILRESNYFSIEINSTSKINVDPGPIFGPAD